MGRLLCLFQPAKKSKKEKDEERTKLRKEASLTKGMDFSHECKTADGRKPNVKIASWNINGIRAWLDVSQSLDVNNTQSTFWQPRVQDPVLFISVILKDICG